MPITSPTQLVDEFKNSGEFDRLRRELITQFQKSDGIAPFRIKVEELARERLRVDQRLQYMPHDMIHRELLQEMDRYPTVERAVAELEMLSDPAFTTTIQNSIQRIISKDKGVDPGPSKHDTEKFGKRVRIAEPTSHEPAAPQQALTSQNQDIPVSQASTSVAQLLSPATALAVPIVQISKPESQSDRMDIVPTIDVSPPLPITQNSDIDIIMNDSTKLTSEGNNTPST